MWCGGRRGGVQIIVLLRVVVVVGVLMRVFFKACSLFVPKEDKEEEEEEEEDKEDENVEKRDVKCGVCVPELAFKV